MTFLLPIGLLALLALPAIVLLHLMKERRKRVAVPSLLLWRNLPLRQDARRRRRLPLTLLLLLHLLAAALIGLAIGQPQLLGAFLSGSEHLAVIIDTSTSMAASDGPPGSTRLDQARARARALIGGLRGGSLTLIAAGSSARVVAAGGPDAALRLRDTLDDLSASGVSADMLGALTLAQAALDGRPNGRIVVLSDGALPTLPADLAGVRFDRPVTWEQIGQSRSNRAIVTLAARGGGDGRAPARLFARVANYGDAPVVTRLLLLGDERLLDTRRLNLAANGETELTWTLPPGVAVVRAQLEGTDALAADDVASLSLAQTRPVKTLLVSSTSGPLERALKVVPGLSVAMVTPIAYKTSPLAAEAELTVFDGTLPERWPIGGVLVINPPVGDGGLLTVRAARRNTPAPAAGQDQPIPLVAQDTVGARLIDGLSLASVTFGLVDDVAPPDWATVEVARGDLPLIISGRAGQSRVMIWSFDLIQSNLTSRVAFPLLVARAVRELTPSPLPPALLAGEPLLYTPGPRADMIELRAPDGQRRKIPVDQAEDDPQRITLDQPGVYVVTERAGDTTLFEGQVAVNAGAAAESDLRPQPITVNTGASPAAGAALLDERNQQPLWPWLAGLALAVMIFEWGYVHRGRVQT